MSDVTRVEKPWGYELHWAKTDRYVGKLIHINKGHALSLQYHNQKDETIFLWRGKLLFEIEVNGKLEAREMQPGESVHVTPPTVHRMILTLHERGLIERVPGQPRSIILLVPPDQLPPLQSIKIPATGY